MKDYLYKTILRVAVIALLSLAVAASCAGCFSWSTDSERYTSAPRYSIDFDMPSLPPPPTIYPIPTVSIAPLPTISPLPTYSLAPLPTFDTDEEKPALPKNSPTGSDIEILSVTSPVDPDGYATIAVHGKSGIEYDISVIYYSGPSKARGLYPKTADSDGIVSWTWHVGPSTRAGDWEIIITGGGETAKTYFTVTG